LCSQKHTSHNLLEYFTMTIDVAILGATGAVGQRFIQLLENHPWFRVAEVVASERSSHKTYAEATTWVLTGSIPTAVAGLTVKPLDADLTSRVVFSALPTDAAKEVEPRLASKGHFVFSNASTYRMASDIPILLPEINAEHAKLVEVQQKNRGWSGAIVTNSNCTAAPLVMALKPLLVFEPTLLHVVSMQAVSGAGYPGVASLDILDNVVPFIKNEEDKLNSEPRKMLGSFRNGQIEELEIKVSAACNRVPVLDSHLICVMAQFAQQPTIEEIIEAWDTFQAPDPVPTLPSAPAKPLVYTAAADRPQPRRDREAGAGMTTTIGRLRPDEAFGGVQFIALSHNTIRGAAGCSILNAELLVAEGYIDEPTAALTAVLA
jgi:aspartate-semialdehyde dehydrogenase